MLATVLADGTIVIANSIAELIVKIEEIRQGA